MAKRMSDDDAPRLNLSPDTFIEHFRLVSSTKLAVDQANSAHQHAVKRAEKAGIDGKVLLDCIRLMKQDEDLVQRMFSDKLTYLAWLGRNIQLNMTGADQAPTEKSKAELREHEAEQQGYDHGIHGGTIADCPFVAGSPLAAAWHTGLRNGQAFMERSGKLAAQKDKETNVTSISGKRGRRDARNGSGDADEARA